MSTKSVVSVGRITGWGLMPIFCGSNWPSWARKRLVSMSLARLNSSPPRSGSYFSNAALAEASRLPVMKTRPSWALRPSATVKARSTVPSAWRVATGATWKNR